MEVRNDSQAEIRRLSLLFSSGQSENRARASSQAGNHGHCGAFAGPSVPPLLKAGIKIF
jgi:hypothetical protein